MFRTTFLAHLAIDQAVTVELAKVDDIGTVDILNTL